MSTPGYRKPGFAAGLRWLPAAAEVFFSGFGPLAGLAALWLLVSVIAIVPLVGQLAVMLITPLLTAGAIAAFGQVAAGRRPAPTMLFAAWGRPQLRNRLFGLGAFGIVGSLLALLVVASWLAGQVTPEQIEAAQQSTQAMAEMLEQVTLGPMLLVAAGIIAVVMAAMYFAIPLVMFRDISTASALTTSLRAVFANWSAFLGFGLVVIAMVVALGMVFGLVMVTVSLALGTAGQMIAQVVFMLAAMLVQVLMAGTQWVAYSDVFGSPGGDGQEPEDQLLA
ncbi:BPSS1780 family membrane protein [Wenzhouxiangella sp. EGI_FJ10305]|uniref:BPSS1780 family membrane protein n=1 Tax=Wenzhouxiangella sp. EGI_FJ10305 TaxID=3243768 RepID=UPI0035E0B119